MWLKLDDIYCNTIDSLLSKMIVVGDVTNVDTQISSFFLQKQSHPHKLWDDMVSKAWYKPSALPQLIARFESSSSSAVTSRRRAIEVYSTPCIVTNFGKQCDVGSNDDSNHLPQCSVLVNPANPNLTGPNSFVSVYIHMG